MQRIRSATLADASVLATLVTALGHPTTAGEMAGRLAAILARTEYATFLAELDGTVVGMAGAMMAHFYEKNGSYARLVALVVDPAHRGSGVGERLVQAVERWGTQQGACEVVVNSAEHRSAAHRFYERAGYRVTGLRFVKALSAAG
jgi:GNAT superfamily N-acetyltransferase